MNVSIPSTAGTISVSTLSARLKTVPFIRAIGMTATAFALGSAVTRVDAKPSLSGGAAFSDGAVAAVLDQAGSAAIWTVLGLDVPLSTISLSVSFAGPVHGDALIVDAALSQIENGIACTVARLVDPQDPAPRAQAMITYMVNQYPGDAGCTVTGEVSEPGYLNGERIDDLNGEAFTLAAGFVRDGDALSLDFRANLAGSRTPVALHGGVVAAGLIAAAENAAPTNRRWRLSQIAVDYLRSSLPRHTRFVATLVYASRKTVTVRADAVQDDGLRHTATAQLRFVAEQND